MTKKMQKDVVNPSLKITHRQQQTIAQEVSYSGIGIHTGAVVNMKFAPAKEGTGIVFKRVDLPGQPIIPATIEYVCDTSRSTTIGVGNIRVHTIEHVMAAVHAYDIDNLIIEVSTFEPPVGNGSSDVFVDMIESVGISQQQTSRQIVQLQHPIYHSENDIHLVALPSEEYRISYTLSYPETPALKAQFHSIVISSSNFKREIAPCRTFSLWEEVSMLMDRGLIKGGSLDNAVVIKGDAVLSKNGLFFSDEPCRHKILDMVGDLSLVGMNFRAHIIAIRSGHATNFALAKKLYHYLTMENG